MPAQFTAWAVGQCLQPHEQYLWPHIHDNGVYNSQTRIRKSNQAKRGLDHCLLPRSTCHSSPCVCYMAVAQLFFLWNSPTSLENLVYDKPPEISHDQHRLGGCTSVHLTKGGLKITDIVKTTLSNPFPLMRSLQWVWRRNRFPLRAPYDSRCQWY